SPAASPTRLEAVEPTWAHEGPVPTCSQTLPFVDRVKTLRLASLARAATLVRICVGVPLENWKTFPSVCRSYRTPPGAVKARTLVSRSTDTEPVCWNRLPLGARKKPAVLPLRTSLSSSRSRLRRTEGGLRLAGRGSLVSPNSRFRSWPKQ